MAITVSSPRCCGCSWHLLGVLTSLQLCAAHPWQSDQIHSSFSSQLAASGAWDWAVFAAMHLSNPELRLKHVVDLLQHHCCADEELSDKEDFVRRLLVTERIVYQD